MLEGAFAHLAVAFSNHVGGPFVDAVASWPGEPIMDSGGSITTPGTPSNYVCKVQIDAPTQQMRAADDFLETDARLLVLANTLVRDLDTNAVVNAAGARWALLTCQKDSVGVGYECRARKLS